MLREAKLRRVTGTKLSGEQKPKGSAKLRILTYLHKLFCKHDLFGILVAIPLLQFQIVYNSLRHAYARGFCRLILEGCYRHGLFIRRAVNRK